MSNVANKEKNALKHMIAWSIQNIFETHKEAMNILNDKELTDEEKKAKLIAPDYRVLNLIILLKPSLEYAREFYPEQTQFFEWFDEKWKFMQENNMLQGKCQCKGCKE